MMRIVEKIVLQCLGYRKGERILIVTDDELKEIAEIFYQGIKNLGIEVLMLLIIPRKMHGEEPPPEVASALKSTDIALLVTAKSLSHTQARQIASQRYGVRIASLPGINRDIFRRSLDIDYEKLKKRTDDFSRMFNSGERVEVRTGKGTDLSFSIKGRKIFADNGLYIKRGAFGNLPAGEVCLAPREGTTQGILVIDASFAGLGKLKKPIQLRIKNGYVREISDLRLKRLLANLGKSALNIAEFGIGLNPRAKVSGNVLEDEKVIGTAHIALGNNLSFGGKVKAKCHLDGVFFKPLVWLDGKKII
ncbi:MAG: aminopeptidase [Candidatus Omnitrophica bacterium]|nr:aminopeptidase [Candidatus Omnitrophota bacterium]MCM8793838.1 aminopeptidase [Candidatus Omnitrophota bacterium]